MKKYKCDWCKKSKIGNPVIHHNMKPVCKKCNELFLVIDVPVLSTCIVCNGEFYSHDNVEWCSYNCASGG